MGNKNAQKREKKKPAKTQSKPAPQKRSREDFSQAPARNVGESTEK
jgi:hypothetical protein